MNEERGKRNLVAIVFGVIVIITSLVVFGLWQAAQKKGKQAITVFRAPSSSKIYLDGKQQNSTTLYLAPGNHDITVRAEGFEELKQSVTVPSENQDELYFLLRPVSLEARQFASNNSEEFHEIERRAGEYYRRIGAQERDEYPIMDRLPYRGGFYGIDYYLKDGVFRIQISSDSAVGRQVAIEQIKSWGYEPSDFNVEFLKFGNPFEVVRQTNE